MKPWGTECRDLARLAFPIACAHLGMMAMGLVDTAMVGHVSARALAGVALGNSYAFLASHFGMGVLMSLDPVVSQAAGARDEPAVTRALQRGTLLALLLTLPVGLVWFGTDVGLGVLRQRDELIEVSTVYVRAMLPGLPAFYLFFALRQSLQALHRVRPIVITIVVANLANVVLDWALIYGELGMPALGARGCGIATALCRWLLFLGVAALGWPVLGPFLRAGWRGSLAAGPLWRMFRLGAPIGVQNTIEAGAFASIAFLMGWLGTKEVGGHGITLQYAAFAFMVPLGVSSAAAVRVGHGVGARDADGVRRSAGVALAAGAVVMLVSATLFVTIPKPLARLFTDDPAVIPVAASLLPLAGLFQVFDGVQVVASGVLRGIGDVRFPMLIHLAGFWFAGIPLGCLLTFGLGAGPRGLWWGLVLGLGLVSAIFLLRIRVRMRGDIRRIEIDRAA